MIQYIFVGQFVVSNMYLMLCYYFVSFNSDVLWKVQMALHLMIVNIVCASIIAKKVSVPSLSAESIVIGAEEAL